MPTLSDRIKARFEDLCDKPIPYEAARFLGNKLSQLIVAELIFYKKPLADEGLLTHLSQQYRLDEPLQVILAAAWIETGSYVKARKWTCARLDLENNTDSYPCEPKENYPCSFKALEEKILYRFKNPSLLIQALTRQSALEEGLVTQQQTYQTLEFLGDRILGMAIADILHKTNIELSKEQRTKLFISYTHNAGPLAKVATAIKLGPSIIKGAGETTDHPKILSDHIEALLGAMWVDSQRDYEVVYAFVERLWSNVLGLGVSQIKPASLAETEFPALSIAVKKSDIIIGRSYASVVKTALETSIVKKAEPPKEEFPALSKETAIPAKKTTMAVSYASIVKSP
jgi:dsRNA-specific ribonuclease